MFFFYLSLGNSLPSSLNFNVKQLSFVQISNTYYIVFYIYISYVLKCPKWFRLQNSWVQDPVAAEYVCMLLCSRVYKLKKNILFNSLYAI